MKEKTNYLSLLSVISALAVVILHTNGCFWKYSSERYQFTANIIESVMYFAVPVFFMISGALFLRKSKKLDLKRLYSKNILHIVVVFFLIKRIPRTILTTINNKLSFTAPIWNKPSMLPPF